MAVVLPKFADEELVKEDIGETGTTNTITLDLISRSDEDASSELESLFDGNVDTTVPATELPTWFIQLATELTTSYYWVKENGTEEAKTQREEVRKKAAITLEKRFFPSEIR